MKKIMLATVAVFGLTLTHAQTNNTTVQTNKSSKISNRPTVEVRAERSAMRLKDELTLTDDQFKKVYETKLAAYTKIQTSNDKYRASENSEAHKAEKKAIYNDFMKGMKDVLTAEQHTKWETSNNERYERWKTAATSQPQAPKPDFEEHRMRMDIE